jgi:hypothetical protein
MAGVSEKLFQHTLSFEIGMAAIESACRSGGKSQFVSLQDGTLEK